MRSVALIVVSAVVLSVLPGLASAVAQTTGTTKTVSVVVNCPNDLESQPVDISIKPWVASIHVGDEIEWDLTMTATNPNDEIEIAAKDDNKWPFDKKKEKKPKKVKSGKAKKGAAGSGQYDDYYYTITVTCHSDSVVIDPRVRVGGG